MLTSLKRICRKHRLALLLAATYLFTLFFPMLFLGRVLSPNDIYYQHDPWAKMRVVEPQNPLIHDPPVSYYTLISLLREDPSSFHWNRYVASGIPGFGSAAAAVLSPLILLPALLLPMHLVYAGIIALKFLVSFGLAYWWLREERLGKRGAAVGAILFSASGLYAVWWLWQSTNATVLYPAVFVFIARAFRGKRNSVALMTLIVVSLLLSGFPQAVAYGGWLGLLYVIYLAIRERKLPLRELAKGSASVVLGGLIAAPFLAPLLSFLDRTGYFASRTEAGYDFHYPWEHLRALLQPFRLGDPTAHLWIGDQRLAISNNFIESTIYLGIGALVLAPLAIMSLRARHRVFWAVAAVLLIVFMFGGHHAWKDFVGEVPGVKYAPLTRLRVLLPLAVAYLGGAALTAVTARLRWRVGGAAIRQPVAAAIGLIVVADLALFAGHFYPYIYPRLTRLPQSPTLEFLRQQEGPFRIAAFFNYLVPNTAELVRLEDIRSQFGSERLYRELLRRFDAEGWGGRSSVIMFNSLNVNITEPVLAMSNVRYLVEPIPIDILRWRVLEKSVMSAQPVGELLIRPGEEVTRDLVIDIPDMYALDLNIQVVRAGRAGRVEVELIRPETGAVVVRRRWSATVLKKEPKIYLPVYPHAAIGNVLRLRIRARDMIGSIPVTAKAEPRPLLYGKVRVPIIPAAEFVDGRIFENVAALPRHWAVWNTRTLAPEVLRTAGVDFSREAIFRETPPEQVRNLAKIVTAHRRAGIRLVEYSGSRQVLETNSLVPFLLATSEKLTPELQVRIDGEPVPTMEINGLFAGVRVSHGRHRIELVRRIGRGWWPSSFAAAAVWAGLAAFEIARRCRP